MFALIEHPQTNGQAESANRILLRGLKRRLEKAKVTWSEEITRILLSYDTTPQLNQKDTFLFGIWVKCHDTSGDTKEFSQVQKFCC